MASPANVRRALRYAATAAEAMEEMEEEIDPGRDLDVAIDEAARALLRAAAALDALDAAADAESIRS